MATIASPRSASPAIPHITSPLSPSATNTPTSSVRASIDLPSYSHPSAQPQQHSNNNTPTNPNQRRNRAALRDYYNLKTKPSSATGPPSAPSLSRTASITSTTSNFSSATLTTNADTTTGGLPSSSILPPAIDDPTFDADSYIADLLKTSSLRDILRAESSLVSEIRNLDGERKALVYDNYSKLIVAVGTIGEMQRGIVQGDRDGSGLGRMKGLEGKLESLMKGFEGISGKTVGGSDTEGRVDERRKIREEKKRKELVSWVLNAPERLEDLIASGKREEADKEWEAVRAILDKWEGVKGVEDVRTKCKKALQEEEEEDDNEGD